MCFLFTHGILYLLGYDHMTDEQEKKCLAYRIESLGALSIEREGSLMDYQYLVDEAFKARENAYTLIHILNRRML